MTEEQNHTTDHVNSCTWLQSRKQMKLWGDIQKDWNIYLWSLGQLTTGIPGQTKKNVIRQGLDL